MMNEEYYEDMEDEEGFVVEKENEEFASEFFDGVRGETEYSFLVFEGIDLFYYDWGRRGGEERRTGA